MEKTLKIKEKREKFNTLTLVIFGVLILYCVMLFIPIFWGIMTSFKDAFEFDVMGNINGFPKTIYWNYGAIFEIFSVKVATEAGDVELKLPTLILYSFLYATGCGFMSVAVPCVTAYMCANYPYRISKILYSIVIVTMVTPIVGNTPSQLQFARFFGLYDSIWGLWIMAGNFLGMGFLIFYAAFKNLPNAYSEAAKIDGASNMAVFLRINLPLVKNLFMTYFLMNFIIRWNDYSTPLLYLPHYPTFAVGIYKIINEAAYSNQIIAGSIPLQISAAVILLVPIVIIFICCSKRMLGNLTVGGLKG